MYFFGNLRNAASFALRVKHPAFVFDGPEDDYVVAIGREAQELLADGHEAYSLQETVRAASVEARLELVEEGEEE